MAFITNNPRQLLEVRRLPKVFRQLPTDVRGLPTDVDEHPKDVRALPKDVRLLPKVFGYNCWQITFAYRHFSFANSWRRTSEK